MAMNVINSERMRQISIDLTGNAPFDPATVTELIRNELWARGVTSRRVICDRIVSLMQPLLDLKKDDVQATLDEMDRTGDITFGPRGTLAVSPLRIVDAGNGRYRLFGTLPSRLVSNLCQSGVNRELFDNSKEKIASLIEQYGGIQLSAERWAGFERVPPVGPDWLKSLDSRMADEACELGSLERELNSIWMVCRPSHNQPPWKKPVGNDGGKLWQAWTRFKLPIHVWTEGASPDSSLAMRLTSDEANRTVFALCQQKGFPIVFKADSMGSHMTLRFDSFLPVAEYRYLMIFGEMQNLAGSKKAFRIPLEVWPNVSTTLRERLGVTITSSGM